MARLYNQVQPLVFNALLDHPETRADDFMLVREVYSQFVSGEMSFNTVLEHHIELGLPSFASILRARRKLQKEHPELVNAKAAEIRAGEEKEYKAYAVN
jgi:hypothetical protein